MKREPANRLEQGFTLIEVTIALAVSAMMIVAVWSIARSTKDVARHEEERSSKWATRLQSVEMLRRDFRGRVEERLIQTDRHTDGKGFSAMSTADSRLLQCGARTTVDVHYVVTEQGLLRQESSGAEKSETVLVKEPVLLEGWNGKEWTRSLSGDGIAALRMSFYEPYEVFVIR